VVLGRFSPALGQPFDLLQKALRLLLQLVAHEFARGLLHGAFLVVERLLGVVRVFHRGVDIVGAGNFRV
jgi:hypothetical protein